MRACGITHALAAAGVLCFCAGGRPQARDSAADMDRAFQKFWAAPSPSKATKIADDIVATGIGFEEALRRLKIGRPYVPQKSGVFTLRNKTADGIVHYYTVKVPDGYDPTRRYQVRFQLHGGISERPDNQPRGGAEIERLAGAEQIYVLPYAWRAAPWWSEDQILNLAAILDALKRRYNIDENRVVVAGVSDGGTGAYYVAMRDTTPFASFLPLNGHIIVLGQEGLELNKGIFPNNLRNKPLFVVNGGQDRLYPTSDVEPHVAHMKNNGVAIDYHPQPTAGHDTTWWPVLRDTFERFVSEHPRDPLPDTLTWEMVERDARNRAHWLMIDELGGQPESTYALLNVNRFNAGTASLSPWPLFAYQPPAGRVDLVRSGNMITATTEGVSGFTLLLSPDEIDFTQSMKLVVNERVVFDGRIRPSVETLLKWAALDNDRTMLFGAEIHVK